MRSRNPLALFWSAVVVDVVALGFAWSAWKATDINALALAVAIPASLACAAATLVAGRVIVVLGRPSRS